MPANQKYFGLVEDDGKLRPFNSHLADKHWFVLFLEGKTLYSFSPVTGHTEQLPHWKFVDVNHHIQRDAWRYFSEKELQQAFPNHFKNNMSSKFIISKGKLYFNETTKQVERVLTIQDGALVWTSRHKQEAKAYSKSAFRLASDPEVQNYLTEATNS